MNLQIMNGLPFILLLLFALTRYGKSEENVEVFIIPHSHTDAGWFLTYDQYYHGKIIDIFNSVLKELSKNATYKYNWADTNFLARYYTIEEAEITFLSVN